jgi:hypothetical protein
LLSLAVHSLMLVQMADCFCLHLGNMTVNMKKLHVNSVCY